MKKITILISILLAIVFRLSSQEIEIMLDEKNPQTYTEVVDSLFQYIDHHKTSTGIFYDRVFPFAGLDRFNKEKPDTSSYSHFIQAYSEIHRASIAKSELPMEVRELRRAIDRKLNAEGNIVPVGLLAYKFDKIDSHAFDNGKLKRENGKIVPDISDHAELFTTRETFVASPLVKTISGRRITFMISPRWLFSNINEKISNLEIDFDDGAGFRRFNFREEQLVNINYTKSGKKVLAFRMEFDEDEVIETKASFNLTYNNAVKSNEPDWPYDPAFEFEADIPFTDYTGNTFKGKGEATYIYSCDEMDLEKPIIIIDGFDPGDKRNDFGRGHVNGEERESIWELFNAEPYNIADKLIEDGYDIVILNFHVYEDEHGVETDGGADFIERNAFVLVELINQVNQTLLENGSDEELVILGPSMGGQVSRYALAYMEQNNMDHNTRLWASIDSPHPSDDLPLGANINYGAQAFLEFFGVVGELEAALDRWQNTVCSNAAKQMLTGHYLQHFSSPPYYHPYHQNFINNMDQIGFPENLRKVSIANGSLNGTLFNSPCQKAYEMEYKPVLVRHAYAKIYQQPGYGNICKVFEGRTKIPNTLIWVTRERPIVSNENSCSYDVAPGGTYDTYQQIKEAAAESDYNLDPNNAILESHSFISTKSALAYSGYNPDLSEDLSDRNLISTGETPFDSYWGPMGKNMEHATLFDEDLMNWLQQEINNTPMPPSVITGPSHACNSELYQVEHLPDDVTVSWNWSPQSVFSYETPCPGEALCVTVNEFSDNVIITAEISHSDWDKNIKFTRESIQAGTPTPIIYGPLVNGQGKLQLCIGEVAHFVATNPHPDVDEYHWTVHGGDFPIYLGNQQTSGPFFASDPGWYYVEAKQHIPDCGWSNYSTKNFSVIDCGMLVFNVYPNPARSTLNIEATTESDSHRDTFDKNTTYQVKLYNWDAHLMRTSGFTLQQSPHQLDMSHLRKGKYILHITGDEEVLHKEQVVIE